MVRIPCVFLVAQLCLFVLSLGQICLGARIYLDDLEVNPSYAGWYPGATATANWTTVEARSGSRSVRIDSASAARPKWHFVAHGDVVEMTFYTKGTGGGANFYLYHFDNTSQWKQQTYVFRTSTPGGEWFNPIFSVRSAEDAYFVDDIELSTSSLEDYAAWGDDVLASTGASLSYGGPTIHDGKTPKAHQKLKSGEALRIVGLGDSIMNDTNRAPVDGYIERAFPGSAVELITSVRGGTGAWWFDGENRLDEYVFQHNPDLVIIGGISHLRPELGTTDADLLALASVVERIQARDIEVVLALKESEAMMQKIELLASSTDVAAIDIDRVFTDLVASSGHDSTYFMRDAIHMNHRGSELLARAVSNYFTAVPEPTCLVAAMAVFPFLGRRLRR